jgi:hypothetical protein
VGKHRFVASSSSAHVTNVGTPVCAKAYAGISYSISYTPHAAGDTITIAVGGGATTVTGATDNLGTAYTNIVNASAGSADGAAFGVISAPSGVTTIKLTLGSATYIVYCIAEFSGAVAFGNTLGTGTWSSTATSYTQTVTTQDPNNYVVTFGSTAGATATTPTATSGTVLAHTANAYDTDFLQGVSSASPASVSNSGTLSSADGSTGYLLSFELRTL